MEPLTRVLTMLTLSVVATQAVYTLTVAGLWLYVAERFVWWAVLGGAMTALLTAGSWWVVQTTRPTAVSRSDGEAAPAPPGIAGRVGPRASPLDQARGLNQAEGSRRVA
ncbi:hypothetical protein MalM25_05440 [Planctomycetes bacterium MalM25]|nr:hypothetical protein MalM25_05440 [Planctomycetes bacterium MalM25]